MAFKLIGSLNPHGGPILRSEIVANSVVMRELDSVQTNTTVGGFINLGVASVPIFGNVSAIQTDQGVGLETNGSAGAATGSFAGIYTMSSTNQTVAKVRAVCDISKDTLYSADPDATIGTTTGSNLLGYHTDITSATATDEDTATTATAQYHIWGVDAGDSGNQVVSIYESSVFGL